MSNVRYLAGLAIAQLTTAPAFAAITIFQDSTFDLPDYTFTEYAQPGYNTTAIQLAEPTSADFNYYFSYQYTRIGPNPAGNRLQALNTGFVWNPATQGALTSIDATVDQRMRLTYRGTQVNLANAPVQLRILAMQDGRVYEYGANVGVFGAQDRWVTASATGLQSDQFTLFDPLNPNAPRMGTGLDFAGSTIVFGFELTPFGVTSNDVQTDARSVSVLDADNLRLTLHSLDPGGAVPEPSTWLLLIAGFGMVGAGIRRQRRSFALA